MLSAGDSVKKALGNAPALWCDSFTPYVGQTQFRLSTKPAGQIMIWINGVKLVRGEHFAVYGQTVDLAGLAYELDNTDAVDITYEIIA